MGMSLLCTVCPALMAASFLIDCTQVSDHEHLNRLVTWYSRRLTSPDADESYGNEPENRVALSAPIIRAYLSPCRSCKNCRYDCQGKSIYPTAVVETSKIRGPCVPVDITKIAKEFFTYEQAG